MRRKKRLLSVLFTAVLLLNLTACGRADSVGQETDSGKLQTNTDKSAEDEDGDDKESAVPRKDTKAEEEVSEPEQPSPSYGKTEQEALERLRGYMELDAPESILAAACLGEPTWHDRESLAAYLNENFPRFVEAAPFVLEIPENRIFGEGDQLFCVVPRDEATSLAVNEVSWQPSGRNGTPFPEVEEILYRSEYAEPLLVFVDYDYDCDMSNIEIDAVAGNGAEVVWYPETFVDSPYIDAPFNEDYEPLLYDFLDLPPEDDVSWRDGYDEDGWEDDYDYSDEEDYDYESAWYPPTAQGLDDTVWYSETGWYMQLICEDVGSDYYDGSVEIFQFDYDAGYSGVWRMDGDCLYMCVNDVIGNVTEGDYPVLISPSGEDLYIYLTEDMINEGIAPAFFEEGRTNDSLIRTYN